MIKNSLILLSLLSVNSIIISSEKKEQVESNSDQACQDLDKLINIFFNKNKLIQLLNQALNAYTDGSLPIDIKDITDKASERFSSPAIKDQFKELYAKHYTADEISQLVKFYDSPIGKKCIEKTSITTAEATNIVTTTLTEMLTEYFGILNIQDDNEKEEVTEV